MAQDSGYFPIGYFFTGYFPEDWYPDPFGDVGSATAHPQGVQATAYVGIATAEGEEVKAGGRSRSYPAWFIEQALREKAPKEDKRKKRTPKVSVDATAMPRGVSAKASVGRVIAAGSAQATVARLHAPAIAGVGKASARGIINPTEEELIAILMVA